MRKFFRGNTQIASPAEAIDFLGPRKEPADDCREHQAFDIKAAAKNNLAWNFRAWSEAGLVQSFGFSRRLD
jgi:hypothetical protein